MSLRFRLILLSVLLVTGVILILSWLYLNSLMDSLSNNAVERSHSAAQQVNEFLVDRLNKSMADQPVPADFAQTEIAWRQTVSNDPEISLQLIRALQVSSALVEINIFGDDQDILASSNPSTVGRKAVELPKFEDWKKRPFYRRLRDLITLPPGSAVPDYEVNVPLGIAGQKTPLFTVQVVASSVLLRRDVLPDVEKVAAVSAIALLSALFITTLVTTRALRPLRRVEQTIDRIAQGNFSGEDTGRTMLGQEPPKELVAVESKLKLLGQQYTGVQQNASSLRASLDEMVERMASQLDVATRLAAISRISGGVAHEIKNPLNAISLRLDLLRARAERDNDELIPEIDVLSNEVRRLDRVVKTFLDFTRPLDVHLTTVDLAATAGEVAALMTPQARATGIELTFEAPVTAAAMDGLAQTAVAGSLLLTTQPVIHSTESTTIRGDPDVLKQAILNLVTNALEALKSPLADTPGRVRVSVLRESDSAILEVTDNGPGIPPDLREKVFQLYFTTKEKGSGIGLAMVYRAVQLHNGTIDFASETGRGTRFRLRFPATQARHV